VLSHSASPQMLVCLDAETVCRHVQNILSPGYILYDRRVADTDLSQLKLLDSNLLETICEPLKRANVTCNIRNLLEVSGRHGNIQIAVDYETLFHNLRDDLGISKSSAERSRNVIAVAISAALLGLSSDKVCSEIEAIFQNKPDAVTLNTRAVQLAYDYAATHAINALQPFIKVAKAHENRLWINGTQSVALGKLAAGLGIQSYYPISPATDESVFLESNNMVTHNDGTQAGPAVLQTEDELAAIGIACGAALTGVRAATSTSGPGFSLMVEGLGWAGMNEISVVVTLYSQYMRVMVNFRVLCLHPATLKNVFLMRFAALTTQNVINYRLFTCWIKTWQLLHRLSRHLRLMI
jgi:2-oxoglutarate ferredoxin oxidoreductase subunit alpha